MSGLKVEAAKSSSCALMLTSALLAELFLGKHLGQLSLNLVILTKCNILNEVYLSFTDILYLGRVEQKIIHEHFILSWWNMYNITKND